MKAVRFHQHGGLEVLKYEEAPTPKIQANEVLVKVKACALNHLDLWLRDGVRATFTDPDCGNLTLDQAGTRGRSGSGASVRDCWGR